MMNSSLASLSLDDHKVVTQENPWGEQAAAPGADETQLPDVDLKTPLEHYRQLRTYWAHSLNSFSLSRHPFGKTFQPTQALLHLMEPKREPLVPIQFESGGALCETGLAWNEGKIPLLPELCQLSLLWALNGEKEASSKLASWLLPLIEHKMLWSQERHWDEVEFNLSAHLLLSYLGLPSASYLSEAKKRLQKPIDPFFLKLERELST